MAFVYPKQKIKNQKRGEAISSRNEFCGEFQMPVKFD
jgi:hypothetical protein